MKTQLRTTATILIAIFLLLGCGRRDSSRTSSQAETLPPVSQAPQPPADDGEESLDWGIPNLNGGTRPPSQFDPYPPAPLPPAPPAPTFITVVLPPATPPVVVTPPPPPPPAPRLPAGCYRISGAGFFSNGAGVSCQTCPEKIKDHCGVYIHEFYWLGARFDHGGNYDRGVPCQGCPGGV